MWRQIKHENVLELYGIDIVRFPGSSCMVLPWVEHGNIREYMRKAPSESSDVQKNKWVRWCIITITVDCWWYFTSCLKQPMALHTSMSRTLCTATFEGWVSWNRTYSHNLTTTIKANILISTDKVAKLADFGLSVFAGEESRSFHSQRGGLERWMAPELLNTEGPSSRPTKMSDVYSFGPLCCEVPISELLSFIINMLTSLCRYTRTRIPFGKQSTTNTLARWSSPEHAQRYQPTWMIGSLRSSLNAGMLTLIRDQWYPM